MSVAKVLWVHNVVEQHNDFIMFHLNTPVFLHAPTKQFPKVEGWFCTLGVNNEKRAFKVEPYLERLVALRNGKKHVNIAKDIDGTSHFYTSTYFNTISPPSGNNNQFAEKLFQFASNFDQHTAVSRGDYQNGVRDGVSWTNSLFKKAGVPAGVRQKGGHTLLPHQMLFDDTLFDLPTASSPDSPLVVAPRHEMYTIQSGDSLSKIAIQHYDDYKLWEKLYNYHEAHCGRWKLEKIGGNPNLIFPGRKLIIPPKSALS